MDARGPPCEQPALSYLPHSGDGLVVCRTVRGHHLKQKDGRQPTDKGPQERSRQTSAPAALPPAPRARSPHAAHPSRPHLAAAAPAPIVHARVVLLQAQLPEPGVLRLTDQQRGHGGCGPPPGPTWQQQHRGGSAAPTEHRQRRRDGRRARPHTARADWWGRSGAPRPAATPSRQRPLPVGGVPPAQPPDARVAAVCPPKHCLPPAAIPPFMYID